MPTSLALHQSIWTGAVNKHTQQQTLHLMLTTPLFNGRYSRIPGRPR